MTHIVDQLIEERAVNLMRHPALWARLKRLVYPLLRYDTARDMADTIAPLSGVETLDYLRELLDMEVVATGLDNVPSRGLAMITPNHPAGIADGIAVYDALRKVRDDITFFANRDAVRVCPGLADMIVPVEWRDTERSRAKARETLKAARQAFESERLVVVFPSGRLARPTPLGLWERPWQSAAFALAIRYGAPVLPVYVQGHNSLLYYSFWFLNRELKDMTLFREVLDKRGRRYRLDIGESFQPSQEPAQLARALRRFVVRDMRRGARRYPTD